MTDILQLADRIERAGGEEAHLREQIAHYDALKVVGQFTIEAWAGGWMAQAYQGGPGSSVCLFGVTERDCFDAVSRLYARGKVPMNARPSSEYHAEAARYRLVQALSRADDRVLGEEA